MPNYKEHFVLSNGISLSRLVIAVKYGQKNGSGIKLTGNNGPLPTPTLLSLRKYCQLIQNILENNPYFYLADCKYNCHKKCSQYVAKDCAGGQPTFPHAHGGEQRMGGGDESE
jgi:hypothetical protein